MKRALLAVVVLSSCTLKLDFDGLSGGAADAGSETGTCPAGKGPTMVRSGSFCIDATEVTNAQYALFVAAAGVEKVEQHRACAFNTDFAPTSKWPAATERANHPVGDVDWCDAWAYCKWSGKRLCGAIAGGPARYEQPTDLTSQWYSACTAGGARRYPYGADYREGICNGAAGESAGPRAVGAGSECVGGAPGLFDMSGNVWEWEDACAGDTGATDVCSYRGGSWGSSDNLLACDGRSSSEIFTREDTREKLGIRCCSP